MFVIVTSLSYQWQYGHFLKSADSILFELRDNCSSLNYAVRRVAPQRRDRNATTDYCDVASPFCTSVGESG